MSTRIFDIIFSLIVLILAAPLCLLLALGVKLSSKGPVFFTDIRVVGPRAYFKSQIDTSKSPSIYNKILSVKPGITGLWQISGRSNLSYKERVALEESYVDKKSFLLDLKIILKTLPAIFFSKGAY